MLWQAVEPWWQDGSESANRQLQGLLIGSSSSRANGYGDTAFLQELEGTIIKTLKLNNYCNSANVVASHLTLKTQVAIETSFTSTVVQDNDTLRCN